MLQSATPITSYPLPLHTGSLCIVSMISNKKAVLVARTPREDKAVYPSDWMRKFRSE